ncbi:MAG: DUF4276 family protein [Steroidobacteraceae bacterium]|nr:DUF4276 family protein [Steroidobacteraceae bacterium]
MRLVSIVEGDGEVAALPVLLRRLSEWRTPGLYVEIPTPIRVRRDRFLNRDDEFRRFLLLAAAKSGTDGEILILLDADDDCPAELSREILDRTEACLGHRRTSVVLANREYESWFVAAAESLHGYRGFVFNAPEHLDCESIRDAKGWLKTRIEGGSYGETTDQPAFSARMDLIRAFERSRSFRKLCMEWQRHFSGREGRSS